ncbi:Crp/Fnr family transcriptional regulator [Flavobacterium sp. 25HG05S-40]|uniref:Crp/Fnr family transcriptional regulator n=1 Tax=Flavobacterium sp. 25HG05S-40 TaxID=3458682 RepID=UPI00404488F2
MNSKLKDILEIMIPELIESELTEFASLWTINKTIKRNDYLYPKRNIDDTIYIVESGALKIGHEDKDQEIIVAFSYEGTFVFDLTSFFTSKPSNFYIQAIKTSKLWGISKTDFYHAIENNLTLSRFWRSRIELIILNLVEREVDILNNSPKKRYEMLLNRNKTVFQKIPHKYIAAYLRMTPETLSRLKKY